VRYLKDRPDASYARPGATRSARCTISDARRTTIWTRLLGGSRFDAGFFEDGLRAARL